MSALIQTEDMNLLARRSGYNTALRQFRVTQELAAYVADGYNLADVIFQAVKAGRLDNHHILPILNLLLVEKYSYLYRSENLVKRAVGLERLAKSVCEWSNIQVVLTFVDPSDSVRVINPETQETWEGLFPLASDTHLVCYVGALDEVKEVVLQKAIMNVFTVLYGGRPSNAAIYQSLSASKKFLEPEAFSTPDLQLDTSQSAQATASLKVSKKLTAKLGVIVTNELFHNGNVEAWKRIIESYRSKYPYLDVLIWYDGERVYDINSLFKWGKVKHGTPIMFSVAGDNPSELSKLKKYLYEGASYRFEAFLHGSPGSVLKLF